MLQLNWIDLILYCVYLSFFSTQNKNFVHWNIDSDHYEGVCDFTSTAIMVCLHCPTLRSIKNGLYRIVWRCSYCTETDTKCRLPLGSVLIYQYPCLPPSLCLPLCRTVWMHNVGIIQWNSRKLFSCWCKFSPCNTQRMPWEGWSWPSPPGAPPWGCQWTLSRVDAGSATSWLESRVLPYQEGTRATPYDHVWKWTPRFNACCEGCHYWNTICCSVTHRTSG